MAFAPVLVPVSLPASDGKSEYHRLHSNRRFRKDSVPPESSHPRCAPYPMHSLPIHTAPPTPITRYENDSVSCQPKPGDIFTRPANTNRKRGFSTRPSRSVRITRQTHGQLFKEIDTVKNGQHNRGYDTKGVHTDCSSKTNYPKRGACVRILQGRKTAAIPHPAYGRRRNVRCRRYVTCSRAGCPSNDRSLECSNISNPPGRSSSRSNTSSTTCSDPSRSYGASENTTSNRFDALFR